MSTISEMVSGGYLITGYLFKWEEFIKLKRTRCGSVAELKTDYPSLFEAYPDAEEFLSGIWDSIAQTDPREAFAITNNTKRSIYFHHIGPVRMMQNIPDDYKKRTNVFKAGENMWDTYELWEVDPKALKLPTNQNLQIVRCWCPSKLQEHWIWVDHRLNFKDAGTAIAWTCTSVYPIEAIEEIYRQGEVYIFRKKEGDTSSRLREPIHLTKEQYFKLLTVQT